MIRTPEAAATNPGTTKGSISPKVPPATVTPPAVPSGMTKSRGGRSGGCGLPMGTRPMAWPDADGTGVSGIGAVKVAVAPGVLTGVGAGLEVGLRVGVGVGVGVLTGVGAGAVHDPVGGSRYWYRE